MKFTIAILFAGIIGFAIAESTDQNSAPKSLAKSNYHSITAPVMNMGEQIIEGKPAVNKYLDQAKNGFNKKEMVKQAFKDFKESITNPESKPTFFAAKIIKKIIHRNTLEWTAAEPIFNELSIES